MNTHRSASTVAMRPVQQSERIHILDILRGFAIFGILAVNLAGFASPAFLPGYAPPDSVPWYDELAQNLVLFFAEGKFYTIFAFLFGLGFAVQLRSRPTPRARISVRSTRDACWCLFGFGVLHSILFWTGDILRLYAVLGFALLTFRNRSSRTLLDLGRRPVCALLCDPGLPRGTGRQGGGHPRPRHRRHMARAAYTSSSYLDVLGFQTLASPLSFLILLMIQGPSVMALFFMGLLVGRLHFFERLPEHRPVLRHRPVDRASGRLDRQQPVRMHTTAGWPAWASRSARRRWPRFYVSELSLLSLRRAAHGCWRPWARWGAWR